MDLNDLLESLADTVVADDIDSFRLQLETLPLNSMEPREIELFYGPLLNVIAEYRRRDFVVAVEERDRLWFFEDVEVPDFPFFVRLFLNLSVSIATLRWVGSAVYSDFSAAETIDLIRNYDDIPRLKQAGVRILEVFPVEISQLRSLVDICGTQSNYLREALLETLVHRLQTTDNLPPQEYAAVPPWVIDGEMVPLEEIGSLIEEEKTRLRKEIDSMNDHQLRSIVPKDVDWSTLTNETRRDLAYWFSLQRSEVIFQLLGPPNPTRENVHLDEIGCRLFTCERFEEERWFDGVCDHCFLKIRIPQHSVRLPLTGGGWRNSYCSWRCAVSDLIEMQDFTADDKVRIIQFIKYFMVELNRVGVLETEEGCGGEVDLMALTPDDLDAITRNIFNKVVVLKQ